MNPAKALAEGLHSCSIGAHEQKAALLEEYGDLFGHNPGSKCQLLDDWDGVRRSGVMLELVAILGQDPVGGEYFSTCQ